MGAQAEYSAAAGFADLLASRADTLGTVACVGLDPDVERLPADLGDAATGPAEAFEVFCTGVIDAVADLVPAVKPQSACFERYGSAGVAALERVCHTAREAGLIVILDAKRGDIGVSARHYAAAAKHTGVHAITVNAYLGMETVEPYLDAGLGVFVLVRTSNPGSDAFQGCPASMAGGTATTVAGVMAEQTAALGGGALGQSGLSGVGAVVGATKAAEGEALRVMMPDQVFLVPGFGAQGGTAEDVRRLVRRGAVSAGESGVIVNASRSVLYPQGGRGRWQTNVRDAAEAFVRDLGPIMGAASV